MKRLAVFGILGLVVLVGVLGASPSETQDGRSSATKMVLSTGAHLGPALESFGPIVSVDSELPIPTDHQYKIVFELTRPSESPEVYNDRIDSAARFLNMHVEAGVPLDNLDIKVVLHGQATLTAMNDAAYRAKFGVDNPNIPLFEALSEAGVEIYVCGQAAHFLDVPHDQLASPVKLALSAMTAVAFFQSQGYQLLPW